MTAKLARATDLPLPDDADLRALAIDSARRAIEGVCRAFKPGFDRALRLAPLPDSLRATAQVIEDAHPGQEAAALDVADLRLLAAVVERHAVTWADLDGPLVATLPN